MTYFKNKTSYIVMFSAQNMNTLSQFSLSHRLVYSVTSSPIIGIKDVGRNALVCLATSYNDSWTEDNILCNEQ